MSHFEAFEKDGLAVVILCSPGNTGPEPEAPDAEIICEIGTGPDAMALAKKFAAAPEMAEALSKCLSVLNGDEQVEIYEGRDGYATKTCDMVRAALKKAGLR